MNEFTTEAQRTPERKPKDNSGGNMFLIAV
jgi:hypothetical protein